MCDPTVLTDAKCHDCLPCNPLADSMVSEKNASRSLPAWDDRSALDCVQLAALFDISGVCR